MLKLLKCYAAFAGLVSILLCNRPWDHIQIRQWGTNADLYEIISYLDSSDSQTMPEMKTPEARALTLSLIVPSL